MDKHNSDKKLFDLLEAEVRNQEQIEASRVLKKTEAGSQHVSGFKGPTLHYRGKGHQGKKT